MKKTSEKTPQGLINPDRVESKNPASLAYDIRCGYCGLINKLRETKRRNYVLNISDVGGLENYFEEEVPKAIVEVSQDLNTREFLSLIDEVFEDLAETLCDLLPRGGFNNGEEVIEKSSFKVQRLVSLAKTNTLILKLETLNN